MAEQVLRQLQEQIQQLAGELATARQEAAAARATADAATAAAQAAGQTNGQPLRTAISETETRMIGKPDQFDGTKWRDWSTVFKAYTGATSQVLATQMAEAARAPTAMLNAVLPDDETVQLSAKLHYWLIQTCRGQAMDVVVNAGAQEGLEAWRQLHARYEPLATTRFAGQLMGLLGWDFSGDMLARVEAFEREVSIYEQSSKEKLTDAIRIGVVFRQLPESQLKQHMILNAERLKTWAEFREEMLNVRRAQAAVAAGSGTAPMDLSWMSGKDKGKGKCAVCHKPGHYARDCWYKDPPGKGPQPKGGKKGKGDGKGKSKSKFDGQKGGYSGAGAGRGQQRDPQGDRCWTCNQTGHRQAQCPLKKKSQPQANALTPAEPAQEPENGNKSLRGLSLATLAADTEIEKATKLLKQNGFSEDTVKRLFAFDKSNDREITFGVDSGAAATVIPSGMFGDYETEQNDMSLKGDGYRSADGGWVPDEGTKRILGTVRDAKGRSITKGVSCHVAPVQKALMSVSDMVEAGHVVQFGPTRSFCRNTDTGEEIDFVKRRGVYEITMNVMPAGTAASFRRQAHRGL